MGSTNSRGSRGWIATAATVAAGLVAVAALAILWLGNRATFTLRGARVVLAGHEPVVLAVGVAGAVVALLIPLLRARNARRRARANAASEARAAAAREAELEERVRDLASALEAREAVLEAREAVLGASHAQLLVVDAELRVVQRYAGDLAGALEPVTEDESVLELFERALPEAAFEAARTELARFFRSKPDAAGEPHAGAAPDAGDPPDGGGRRVLDDVEIEVVYPDGTSAWRRVRFDFRAIVGDGTPAAVVVAVADVTETRALEDSLRETARRTAKDVEVLVGILHVDPRELDAFVALAKDQLAIVEGALSAPGEELRGKRLDFVLQRVHNITGNAALLQLDAFERKAFAVERSLDAMRAGGHDDRAGLLDALAAFRADLETLQASRVRAAAILQQAASERAGDDDILAQIGELATTLAARIGKSVTFDAAGFDTRALDPEQRVVVKDVLIQLIRNSVAHGIEFPEEREVARKSRVARIEVRPDVAAPPEAFAFTFRDDGRGLDARRIRERAVAAGLVPEGDAANIDDSELAAFIFTPGFSTAEDATAAAGRGMGMSVIKQRVVDDCGGEIAVASEPGSYCEFSFVLPAPEPALAN